MNTHLTAAVLVFSVCAVFGGCSSFDYDAALFTDDGWIAKEGDRYSFIRRSIELSSREAFLDFSGFYGKQSLWLIESAKENELHLSMSIREGLRGKFKLCSVSPDGTVTVLSDSEGTVRKTLNVEAGRQYLTIVGYAASGSAAIQLSWEAEPEELMVSKIHL